ncbi:TetR/AcrR family transcriptional regulator [Chryseobacterium rhizosphaerae]|uniref:TetR/AcrR family transcriptional regulator n=1 Tax=Chryseobacterium rhizosphaerae TaxID=395937 RepID=UPI0023588EC5|nr:TetR/AcrR family transcriptional regulator [Chryseobacterium rhizosphaerae]MDC8099446.1 TetR/AcrR family transcriptional regulator [Chryseobacterium rhizosphaerae]
MKTKDLIIAVSSELLTEKGYNAFSYADISDRIKIKKASIHYYFPTKTDLGIAIIENHKTKIESLHSKQADLTAFERLHQLGQYYIHLINENKICLMGTLASDGNTIEPALKEKSMEFCQTILRHTIEILNTGIDDHQFKFIENTENKAIEILSSLMGLAQIGRIYPKEKVIEVIQGIVNQLK